MRFYAILKSMTQDSIFTKIIRGDVPSYKIYEDELTYAFLDIHPAQLGHTLVIPKAQIDILWELPDEDYQAVMATSQKVAEHLQKMLGKRVGVQVLGLDVPHAHIHLIPFITASDFRIVPDQLAEPDHAALKEIHQKLTEEPI